jgi:hypothetical protein
MKYTALLSLVLAASVSAEKPTFDTLTTEKGDVYHAVTVMTIKPDSIFIMHRDGGRNIKVENLSADLQKKLGIELDDEAKEYRAKANAAKKAQAKADYATGKRRDKLKRERLQALYKKDADNRDGKKSKSSKNAADSIYFILQLTDEGVLAYRGIEKYTRVTASRSASFGGGGGVSGGRAYIAKGTELFHIKLGNREGLVDNQRIKLKTEESGTYQYISTRGSKKTLKQLTGTLLE